MKNNENINVREMDGLVTRMLAAGMNMFCEKNVKLSNLGMRIINSVQKVQNSTDLMTGGDYMNVVNSTCYGKIPEFLNELDSLGSSESVGNYRNKLIEFMNV